MDPPLLTMRKLVHRLWKPCATQIMMRIPDAIRQALLPNSLWHRAASMVVNRNVLEMVMNLQFVTEEAFVQLV